MSINVARAFGKAFSGFMVASLLLLSMAVPLVSAAGEVVSIQDVDLQDGPQTVPIRLTGFTNLGSITVTLGWSGTLVDLSLAQGNLPGGATLGNPDVTNPVSMSYFSGSGASGNFILAYVTVSPLQPGSGTLDLTVTVCTDTVATPIIPTVTDGDLDVLPPTEAWVDDDYVDHDNDGGHIWDYNAFDRIQEGVDAVSASTVNVAAGSYGAFQVLSKNNVNVLGAGPTNTVVNTFVNPETTFTQNAMAYVNSSDNVVLDGIGFAATPISSGDSAIHFYGSDNCEVRDVTINGIKFDPSSNDGYGIKVGSAPSSSASITNTTITNCNVGVSVNSGSSATIDNCTITGVSAGDPRYASYCSTGVHVTGVSTAVITRSTIQNCSRGASAYGPPAPEPGSYPSNRDGCGVYVDCDTGNLVTIGGDGCATSCDILNNDCGIYTVSGAYLTCNYSSIVGNREYGVYAGGSPDADCENNWWGADDGPSHSPGSGDRISSNVDYSPWLDGPCPGGDPVGMNADLQGVARSGEPGLRVNFTDLSTPAPGCTIISWLWDFGDGNTSTAQNPSNTYSNVGFYTVTLTVEDSCGFSDTVIVRAYIVIALPADKDKAEDAKMSVSYFFVDPTQVLPNGEVLVSGNVCNQGGERGTKTVALMVNGHAEQSQTVSVSPGACQQVTFRVSRAVPGTYQVAIDGMVGQFSVLAPRTVTQNVPTEQDTSLGTAGIVAIVVVVLVLIVGLVVILKKE